MKLSVIWLLELVCNIFVRCTLDSKTWVQDKKKRANSVPITPDLIFFTKFYAFGLKVTTTGQFEKKKN